MEVCLKTNTFVFDYLILTGVGIMIRQIKVINPVFDYLILTGVGIP